MKQELRASALFYQYISQTKGDSLEVTQKEWREAKRWIMLEKNRPHMAFVRDFCLLTGNACSGGNFVLTVKVDGTVQPCPFLNDLPLGNIHDTDLWTIWRDRYAQPDLVQFKSTPQECQTCSYRSVCGGGCRASIG